MRQAIIIVPLFFLLLAILYLYTPIAPDKLTYESFISADAQIVITQYDLETRIAELGESPLGQTVNTLDFQAIGRELDFSEAEIEHFLETKQVLEDGYRNPLIKALIGNEVSIALLPFQPNRNSHIEDQILNNLLLVSRPRHGTRLMDFAGWVGSADARMSKIKYGKHSITRIDLEDGRRLSIARFKELLVMSLNEKILRQAIDIHDDDHSGLLENAEYNANREQFTGASLIGFIRFKGLPEMINAVVETMMPDSAMAAAIDKEKLHGYKSAMFGAWREDAAIVDKAYISFDPESLDRKSLRFFSAEPAIPDSIEKVAGDTIIYHWSNQFDPEALLGMFGDNGQQQKAAVASEIISNVTEITGLTAEQLFNLLNDDLTLAIRKMDENHLIPLPRFLITLRSSDIVMLKDAIDRIIEYYSIPVRRKMLEENEIITWGGIVGIGAILPTLSFVDDAIIISSNRNQITDYFVEDGARSLAGKDSFKQLSSDLLQPSNSMTYIDFVQTTEMVKEMVSWGGTMIAIKDRELAGKSKVLIDELINPLLQALSMYSTIGSRKYVDGKNVVIESHTLLEYGN